jgi:hypothetical protein
MSSRKALSYMEVQQDLELLMCDPYVNTAHTSCCGVRELICDCLLPLCTFWEKVIKSALQVQQDHDLSMCEPYVNTAHAVLWCQGAALRLLPYLLEKVMKSDLN